MKLTKAMKNSHHWCEINWTHNLIILERCKDDLQREFYIRMTRKAGWTKTF